MSLVTVSTERAVMLVTAKKSIPSVFYPSWSYPPATLCSVISTLWTRHLFSSGSFNPNIHLLKLTIRAFTLLSSLFVLLNHNILVGDLNAGHTNWYNLPHSNITI